MIADVSRADHVVVRHDGRGEQRWLVAGHDAAWARVLAQLVASNGRARVTCNPLVRLAGGGR